MCHIIPDPVSGHTEGQKLAALICFLWKVSFNCGLNLYQRTSLKVTGAAAELRENI